MGSGGSGGNVDTLITLINDMRNSSGLPALTKDPALTAVAQSYAESYQIHMPSPAAYTATLGGTTLQGRLTAGGLNPSQYDETGVADYASSAAQAAFPLLNQSKLTNPAFTKIGVGFHTYFCTA
jgi:uncharacterized protein YkwD